MSQAPIHTTVQMNLEDLTFLKGHRLVPTYMKRPGREEFYRQKAGEPGLGEAGDGEGQPKVQNF